MGIFSRRRKAGPAVDGRAPDIVAGSNAEKAHGNTHHLPTYNHNGHKVTKGITPQGESGRSWFNPWHFLRICFRSASRASMVVNVLWPVVPAALAFHYTRSEAHPLAAFILNYVAIVPAANLVGFAGQELARKMPNKGLGVILETTLGSVVEIILFMVLLSQDKFAVIQAAILGSILATLLLCLGLVFFVGGLKRTEQEFDEAVSEVGGGLLMTAGLGLIIPAAFFNSLKTVESDVKLRAHTLDISRATSVLLMVAFAIYLFFQIRTHAGIYDSIWEAEEQRDEDRHDELRKDKLTFTEAVIATAIAVTLVTFLSINLVKGIDPVIENHHISDAFMGLILVPLAEKAAEHLTAADEAWDDQMNFALAHVLGATIQTALFNGPLVVIVGWGLGKHMDLNFELFMIVVLILSILVVGNFLRDGKSNYLEGALCVIVYLIIAMTTFFYPSPPGGGHAVDGASASQVGQAVAEHAAKMLR